MSKVSPILEIIRLRYPGYHPLVAIADIAHSENRDVDSRLRFECHKAIAKFVEPEMKSVEVKGHILETRRVQVSLFGEDTEDAEFTDVPLIESNAYIDAKNVDDSTDGY